MKKSISFIFLMAMMSIAMFSCKKDKDDNKKTAQIPTVTTVGVNAITAAGATTGGNVTTDGGAEVTQRGVCWGTSTNPTVSESKTTDGKGTGGFTSSITGLTANTKYYVRAYAVNSAGTAYGNEVSFTTATAGPDPVAPVLTTAEVIDIDATSATAGGNITNTGTPAYTERGVCYATTANPTIANSKIRVDGTGTGGFTAELTGLAANTKYYVLAYATNSNGTVYGNEVSFTTLKEPVGGIPGSLFDELPAPSYEQVAAAYDDIVSQNPALLGGDATEMARALFDKLLAMYKNDPTAYLDDPETGRMTMEEWIIIILDPFNGYHSRNAAITAFEAAVNSFTCNPDADLQNSKVDAIRYAFWNVLLVKATDAEFAEKITIAHLTLESNAKAKTMHLHNSKYGRDLTVQFPTATEEQLLELLLNEPFVYISASQNITDEIEGLVYLEGREQYDTTLAGTFTNPDMGTGVTWNITLTMHQCGATVRGSFVIVRGANSQKRRFTGTIENNSEIKLDIAYPYEFENPAGITPCENMKATLTGDENALTGPWTSTNCNRGGIITLSNL